MALFETSEINSSPEDVFFLENEEGGIAVICKSPQKLDRLVSSIKPGISIHYVSDGDWSTHDLIMRLLQVYKPAELIFTTYALRELAVRQIILSQAAGDITSVKMLIDHRAQVRVPEVYQLASNNFNDIKLTGIHAKVCVLKSPAGSLAIVGSSNWTSNPRVEAGVITMQPEIVDFHYSWINKMLENAEIFK